MEKIKRSEQLNKFLTENKIRMSDKGCGVIHVETKPGSQNPSDELATVLAMILEGNEGLINTAAGVTPIPSTVGTQFKAIFSFCFRQDLRCG